MVGFSRWGKLSDTTGCSTSGAKARIDLLGLIAALESAAPPKVKNARCSPNLERVILASGGWSVCWSSSRTRVSAPHGLRTRKLHAGRVSSILCVVVVVKAEEQRLL